jgi:hypothetical protein
MATDHDHTTSLPAGTGVQPDAPNATHADDRDLAQGPPAVDEEVDVERTDEG